ncbi:MAG: HAD family phosphatase [Spirochaetales bacterium]|nr:HAD family phosphatase [Spirochaetales bacterium]
MQSVIFDMDGVIVDSEPTHFRLERELFQNLGLSIDTAEHEGYVGTNARGMLEEIATRHGAAWERHGMTIDDVIADEYRRYQEQLVAGAVPFVSGAIETIRALSRTELKIAIASSAPYNQIDEVIRRAELGDIVECRISGDDVERSKPDPAIFLRTASCLGSAPSECWVVEDSENGVRAALAAGMSCIAFRNGSSGRQDLSAATHVVDTMAEVARILAP